MYSKYEIIQLIKNNQPMSFKQIVSKLQIKKTENKKFGKFLLDLVDLNELDQNKNGEYYIKNVDFVIEESIKISSKGFGFIDFDDKKGKKISIFIPPNKIKTALDGDIVEVDVTEEKENSYVGSVKKIITRKKTIFVGKIVKFGSEFGIKPLDSRNNGKFRFSSLNNLEENLIVKVEIIKFTNKFHIIKILKILGNKDDVSIDINANIEEFGVPSEFNNLTIEEAKKIPNNVQDEDLKNRVDLRKRMIVTIDGDDTKDFDDAIEIQILENKNFLLSVHIADVAHYVKEASYIDDEALTRGTSVYLVDRVVPMLPEKLSNGICSLNPNEDRLVLSVDMEIDQNGKTINYKIYEGVISSKYRLTYQQVNKYYRNQYSWNDQLLHKMLDHSLKLSKIIRNFKVKEGYIDFEIEESKIIVDSNGKTTDIVPRDRLESEMMIEDFMVRANETIAEHIAKKQLPFIYRVHDKPDLAKLTSLQNIINILKIDVHVPTNAVPKEFASAINEIKKTRFDDFMKILMLRTMAKAEYSPKNIGHFGLASKFYTHFTSPIRRYPDLMVHRMIKSYFKDNNLHDSLHFKSILPKIAEHSSLTEIRATDLERKIDDIKKAEFYENFIGKLFEGIIISIMNFGFFVEFPNKVDGLVHITTLLDGNYELINNGYSLSNGKKIFTIGDKVNVIVVAVQKDEGKIDLVISDFYESWKMLKKIK